RPRVPDRPEGVSRLRNDVCPAVRGHAVQQVPHEARDPGVRERPTWKGGCAMSVSFPPEAPRIAPDAPNDPNPYTEPCETVADVLKALRASRRLSMDRLARRVGVDPSFVSRIESGGRGVPRAILERFADALRATDAERERLLMSAGYGFALEPDVETFRSYPPEVRAKVLELLAVMGGEA